MQWIHDYQLFLFDFDGLLVNTEEIHYCAYRKMCKDRGIPFAWTFAEYCNMAHYEADKLQKAMYAEIPDLHALEPDWNVLYAEKKKAMLELLEAGMVHMMPGAAELLIALQEADIPRCVVTHSPEEQIRIARSKNSVLNTIPHWFTRETYTRPKPHPECYLNAIKALKGAGKKIIGFEDTPRGLRALMQTPAKPVLIAQVDYPEIPEFAARGVLCIRSFEDLEHLIVL